MKVCIDTTHMHHLNKGRGVGFYTQNLYKSLKRYTDIDISIAEKDTAEKFDLIHLPYFDPFFNTLRMKFHPTVVTVHDVTPLIFPNHFPPGIRGRINYFKQKLALKKADGVITDSLSSKKDISRKLGIDKEKIHVVPLAPAEEFRIIENQNVLQAVKKKYSLPDKFALFVGNVNWNKNLVNTAEACKRAGINLVLIGSSFENRDDLNHIEQRSFKEFLDRYGQDENFKILGFVEEEDLVAITNLAEVLLFASFYEGFGLPILQAQRCGVPVITSNNSSLPEVAGDGAIFVDPYDVKDIQNAIGELAKNANLKKDLIKKGLENQARFSWEKTAKATHEIYQKIING
jgi:glycosyltransferase involved in cell wall biosynthesis